MTIHTNIKPTIWVHPRWASVLLRLGAVTLNTHTGQLYTKDGDRVGVDESLPVKGEYSRNIGRSAKFAKEAA